MSREGKRDCKNGSNFLINKNGFPIDNATWENMWTFAQTLNPLLSKDIKKLMTKKKLREISVPVPPDVINMGGNVQFKLNSVQNYITQLQYNYVGMQFFEIRKNRPYSGLMDSAKEMITQALPIKCLEAVILALYLTNALTDVVRFPISFKSVFKTKFYRHIVLGVYHKGKFGAVGLSRRKSLMYKPVEYKSLGCLLAEFQQCYEECQHTLQKVKIGGPVQSDPSSYDSVNWKMLSLYWNSEEPTEIQQKLSVCSKTLRTHKNGLLLTLPSINQRGKSKD